MFRLHKEENQGFSLVEIVVVVLILGILAVTVTPQIMNWLNKAKVGKDEAYAGEVATAVEMLALEYIGKDELDSNEAVYTLTNTVKKTSGGGSQDLSSEIIASIGADMCRTPEQKDKTKFTITITPNGKSVTVKVKAE